MGFLKDITAGEKEHAAQKTLIYRAFCDMWLNPEGAETSNAEDISLHIECQVIISKDIVEEWAQISPDRSRAWEKSKRAGLPPFPPHFYLESSYQRPSAAAGCDFYRAVPLVVDFSGMPRSEDGSIWSAILEDGAHRRLQLRLRNPDDSHLKGIEHMRISELEIKEWHGSALTLPKPVKYTDQRIAFVLCPSIIGMHDWLIDWLNYEEQRTLDVSKLCFSRCPIRCLPDNFLESTESWRSADKSCNGEIRLDRCGISDMPANFFDGRLLPPGKAPLVVKSGAHLPVPYKYSNLGRNDRHSAIYLEGPPLRRMPRSVLGKMDTEVRFHCWPHDIRQNYLQYPDLEW